MAKKEEEELSVCAQGACKQLTAAMGILMLIHSLDEEQSSQANNGSGARKSALQSSRP